MTERAQVLSVDGAIATVRCDTTESCSSCSSILCNPRSRTYEASWDPIAARLAPGDWVEVEVTERGALGKGLLLFGLPIVLFVALYLGLGTLEIDPESAEVVRVAGGFAGLAGGFGLAVLASRLWKEPPPRIVQVYHTPELRPVELPVARDRARHRSVHGGAAQDPR